MFMVTAIEDATHHMALCDVLGIGHVDGAYAYGAFDDDGTLPLGLIALCEFTFTGECVIHSLTAAVGREEDEAVLILGFAVLDFFRRCGFDRVRGNIPERYARRLGFTLEEGRFTLDLHKPSACGGK